MSALSSVSPFTCACSRTSLLVSVGGAATAAAARFAASCPSGDRATHRATSWHFAWWVDDSHSARVARPLLVS